MLRAALEDQGHAVVEARDQTEALARLHDSRPDLVLSDLRLTAGDGFGVLRAAKDLDPELPVIVMTAYGSIQDAVLAMKEGALDFLAKPVDLDHLQLLVARALSQRRLAAENQLLKEELAARRGAPNIVGDDPALKRVSAALARAAATDTTVLLLGESGTGKELYARTLHALSPRATRPVCRHQLRRDSRDAARNRTLRPREGRVHRRHRPQARPLRAGAPRHVVSRRNWRLAVVAAGQDPARARRETLRTRRRHAVAASGRARGGGHQPAVEGRGRRQAVPRGSVLPAVRLSDRDPAAARARGGRGDAGAPFHRPLLARREEAAAAVVAGGPGGAPQLSLAGQRRASCRTASNAQSSSPTATRSIRAT